MLDIKLKVSFPDGTEKVLPVRPCDQVAFEGKFDESIAVAFSERRRLTYLYFLAWSASDTTVAFEEWLRTISGAEVHDVDEVDPTSPAASVGG